MKKRPFRIKVGRWHLNNKFDIYPYKYAIISSTYNYVTRNQVESCRKIISRFIRRQKKKPIYKTVFNYSIVCTKKSLGARMGRGKGPIKKYLCKITKNSIMYIFRNASVFFVRAVLHKIQYKLPLKLKIVSIFRNGYCRNEDRNWR